MDENSKGRWARKEAAYTQYEAEIKRVYKNEELGGASEAFFDILASVGGYESLERKIWYLDKAIQSIDAGGDMEFGRLPIEEDNSVLLEFLRKERERLASMAELQNIKSDLFE